MGMIIAFNALISCLVTGLFTALFILLFVRLGWLPLVSIVVPEALSEEEDENNTTS